MGQFAKIIDVLTFNITFWVQIFKMRNFRDVYFLNSNLQKLSVFQKIAMFLVKFGFTEHFNWRNFRKSR